MGRTECRYLAGRHSSHSQPPIGQPALTSQLFRPSHQWQERRSHPDQAISLTRYETEERRHQVIHTKFVGPVLDQTRRTCDDTLLDRRLSGMGGLLEEGPHESDTLEGLWMARLASAFSRRNTPNLAQTHSIRHNAPILVLD